MLSIGNIKCDIQLRIRGPLFPFSLKTFAIVFESVMGIEDVCFQNQSLKRDCC